jgi:hypothetical protein
MDKVEIRSYLKEVVAGKTFTYSIHDNTRHQTAQCFTQDTATNELARRE